ncbi:tyrosine-type recombinase/integrase [Methylobacterium radiotolerans]|jgi:integrase|uniref:tyrosine-type recombinase/integrase n=1 Tax=Methylobacterium TaxID=407 RepID=UPI0005DF5F04|nr:MULTISPECIES: tyrosine-type recombinase/integrase [Methylobacterium]MBN6820629.1 tyrosine-type recombinase/integrase [Methylobacterium organophilum]GAN48000.1 phage integrase [Methylobacterium sp. ME121]
MTKRGTKRQSPRWIYKSASSPFWQYDFRIGGERHYGSTERTDETEAAAVAAELQEEAAREHRRACDRTGQVGRLRNITWLAALDSYFVEILRQNWAAGSATAAETRFDWLTDQIGERTSVLAIDDDTLKNLCKALRAKRRFDDPTKDTIAPRTINTYIHQVQAVLNHVRDDLKIPLPDAPTWSKHLQETEQRTRLISARELTSIEAEADEDLWNCIEFSLESAIRKRSTALLTWDQVDLEAGVIRFRNKARSRGKRKLKGQVRQVREVNITDRIAEILRAQEGKHDTAVFTFVARRTFFQSKNGTQYIEGRRYPMTVSSYTRSYRALCDRLGIKDLTIHDLRRSRGSFVYRATGSLGHAQHTLKHANYRQTEEAYAFMTTAETGRAMEAGTAYSDAMVAAFKARTGRAPGRRRPGKFPEKVETTAISSYLSMAYQATSTFTPSIWTFDVGCVQATYPLSSKLLGRLENSEPARSLMSHSTGLMLKTLHHRATHSATEHSEMSSELGQPTDVHFYRLDAKSWETFVCSNRLADISQEYIRRIDQIIFDFKSMESCGHVTYAQELFRKNAKRIVVFANHGIQIDYVHEATDDLIDRLYGSIVDERRRACLLKSRGSKPGI